MNTEYTIAVMGATGVGKTVFFGSYFNLVTNLGKGSRPIMVKSQSSVKRITELITQLFEKHEVVQGTSERVDFSFSVDSLGMDVELYDVPGGATQDMDAWIEQEILPTLHEAKGVLFFISGEDLIHNPERVLQDNLVFATAISKIREHKTGDLRGRSDVPIWFIFTKGDTIPDVPLETLKEKSQPLLNAAAKSQDQGSWLAKSIYTKGNYVKAYKSQAIGKWESPQSVPKEYEPDNVVEPMEALFEAMTLSQSRYKKRLRGVMTTAGLLLLSLFLGTLYKIDQNRWTGMQERANKFLGEESYEQALQEVNAFASLPFLPAFLRADRNLKTFRKDFYRDYEAAAYAPIQAILQGIDETQVPNASPSFLEDAEKVKRYLAVSQFAEVQPQHYEQAKSKVWYFDLGRLLSFTSQKLDPDGLFNAIWECLNCDIPADWQSKVQERLDGSLRSWSGALSSDVSPDILGAYIKKTEQLANHPSLSSNSKVYLEREKAKHYLALADQALRENPGDAKPLQELLQRHPSMAAEARDKLQKGIGAIEKSLRDEKLREIEASQTIKDLTDKLKKFEGENADGLPQEAEKALRERVQAEAQRIEAAGAEAVQNKEFTRAHKVVTQGFEALRQDARSITLLMKLLEDAERKALSLLEAKHFEHCREDFNMRRNTKDRRDVTACADTLKDFLDRWPRSQKKEEVRQVRDFLFAIQGGVRGWLAIEKGVFTSAKSRWDKPDIFVTVSKGDSKGDKKGDGQIFKTPTVKDNDEPNFQERREILWAVNMSPLRFEAFDEDVLFNDKVFEYTVDPSGFGGYRKLKGRLDADECYLYIDFSPIDPNPIPECPWLEGGAK